MEIPKHIGFIMDGNRRFARQHGLPTLEGHRRGYQKLKEVGDWCLRRGITTMTVFAFSTENWRRGKDEVEYLMALLYDGLTRELQSFRDRGICIQVMGRREGLPERLIQAAHDAEQATEKNSRGTLYIAINYGGRAEIIDAVQRLLTEGVAPETLDEETFAEHLYIPEAPDPDLIIRTSGEQRTSGFLLWQAAYSELYFSERHWPDFDEAELDKILEWYTNRERRFGK